MIHTYEGPAKDSHVTLYDTDWKLLGSVERPAPEAFFDQELKREARGILTDLQLMWAAFSPDGTSLIWNISTTELNNKERQEATPHLHPVTLPIVLPQPKKQ